MHSSAKTLAVLYLSQKKKNPKPWGIHHAKTWRIQAAYSYYRSDYLHVFILQEQMLKRNNFFRTKKPLDLILGFHQVQTVSLKASESLSGVGPVQEWSFQFHTTAQLQALDKSTHLKFIKVIFSLLQYFTYFSPLNMFSEFTKATNQRRPAHQPLNNYYRLPSKGKITSAFYLRSVHLPVHLTVLTYKILLPCV